MRSSAIIAAAIATSACGGSVATPTAQPAPTQTDDAGLATTAGRDAFDRLEQRLLAARSLEMTAHVTAVGQVRAALDGTLLIEGDRVLLGFDGTFAGEPVELSLAADAALMRGSNGRLSFEHERPGALEDGLLLGFTRMGLLHNLAVLASGNPPHGTFGDARDWVKVHDVREVDDHLAFEIEVGGKRTADARLYLDSATGLPTRREQTVRFAAGTMTVVETYSAFTVR